MPHDIYQVPNTHKISQKGHQIFERIAPLLEKEHHGKFMAIDVDSGEYFLGATILEADEKAREKHPGKVFYVGRIGYRAAVSFKGRR
jgi:hypothetical protein